MRFLCSRLPNARSIQLASVGIALILVGSAYAGDLYVDPTAGDDANDGGLNPVKSLAQAIRLAAPGDTIHLQPVEYRDWAAFYAKSGSPQKPITLDGHGAVLNGCDPISPDGWQVVSPGLFRHDDLLPLTDAIIDRWFFLWDGTLNRMNRCSKGPSQPLKTPESLAPGEWTFVKDAVRFFPRDRSFNPAGISRCRAKLGRSGNRRRSVGGQTGKPRRLDRHRRS